MSHEYKEEDLFKKSPEHLKHSGHYSHSQHLYSDWMPYIGRYMLTTMLLLFPHIEALARTRLPQIT